MSAALDTVPALVRPDTWNLPLFIHVLGSMVMVGALALAASYLFVARRDGSLTAARIGFRALLFGALPAFIAMRGGGEWIADKEGLTDSDAAWIGIGYGISDLGLLLLVVATIVAGVSLRRAGRAEAEAGGGSGVTVAAGLASLLVVLYVVALWAMTTKPA
jgi:hypothetical protein